MMTSTSVGRAKCAGTPLVATTVCVGEASGT